MVKLLIKHKITEYCIDTFFSAVFNNLTRKHNEVKAANLSMNMVGKEIANIYHPLIGLLYSASDSSNAYILGYTYETFAVFKQIPNLSLNQSLAIDPLPKPSNPTHLYNNYAIPSYWLDGSELVIFK